MYSGKELTNRIYNYLLFVTLVTRTNFNAFQASPVFFFRYHIIITFVDHDDKNWPNGRGKFQQCNIDLLARRSKLCFVVRLQSATSQLRHYSFPQKKGDTLFSNRFLASTCLVLQRPTYQLNDQLIITR